jgi:hypothetical protein
MVTPARQRLAVERMRIANRTWTAVWTRRGVTVMRILGSGVNGVAAVVLQGVVLVAV